MPVSLVLSDVEVCTSIYDAVIHVEAVCFGAETEDVTGGMRHNLFFVELCISIPFHSMLSQLRSTPTYL